MNKDEYATAAYWGLSKNVKCVNCKHYPKYELDDVCIMRRDDGYYDHFPEEDFFCAGFTWGKE